jgi:hypothetical protein
VLEPQAPPALIPAGFSLRIGESDWCGLVFARSGLGHREGLVLGNGTGVIDADYEGPLLISAWNRNPPGSGPLLPCSIPPGPFGSGAPSQISKSGRRTRVKTSCAMRSPGSMRITAPLPGGLRFQAEIRSGPS